MVGQRIFIISRLEDNESYSPMKRKKYPHIDSKGMQMMEEIPVGSLLRVSWIEDPEADGEWGLDMIYFEDPDEDLNNLILLLEWMPEVQNNKNIITFKCLHENKIYYSSTHALVEIIKT